VFAPFPWQVSRNESGIRVWDVATERVSAIAGSQNMYSPRWSPDGRYIFALYLNGEPRLLELATGKWTSFPLQGGFPAWSRDSNYVYVFHAYTENRGVYRIDIRTRQIEKVASLQGIDVAGLLGPYGLSLGPDNAPIILRDLSIQEIYAFDLR
jgi:Tol biopolymer transport system component